MYFALISST